MIECKKPQNPLGKVFRTMSNDDKTGCHSSVVEHRFGKAEVDGSIPSDSTNPLNLQENDPGPPITWCNVRQEWCHHMECFRRRPDYCS